MGTAHNKTPDKVVKRIISLYRKGISPSVISQEVGVTPTTIYNHLKLNNIPVRRPDLLNRLPKSLEPEVIRLYGSGMTMKEVGEKVGTSYTTVRNCLVRYGIELRTSVSYIDVHTFDEHFFDKIDTEEKAYFLGYLFADGCILQDRHYTIRLNLHEKDRAILERFKELIRSTAPLYRFNTLNQFCLQVTSKHAWHRLKQLGCVPRKTLILKYPRHLLPELERHFIRGYFDGDGTVGIYQQNSIRNGKKLQHPKVAASLLGTKNFCAGVAKTLKRDLNMVPTIYQTSEGNGRIAKLGVGGPQLTLQFLGYLYEGATIYLERKFQKYLEVKQYCQQMEERKAARPRICSKCSNKVLARGLCRSHYEEWKRESPDRPKCARCEKGIYARGLCITHYGEWRSHGSDRPRCKRCNDPAISNGMCQRHYKEAKKMNDV